MQDDKRGSHTVWDCKYRRVWTTKYRYQVLDGDVGCDAGGCCERSPSALSVEIVGIYDPIPSGGVS